MSIAYRLSGWKWSILKNLELLEEIVISVYNVGEEVEDDNVKLLETVTCNETIIASRTLYKFWMHIEKITPRVFDAIKKN